MYATVQNLTFTFRVLRKAPGFTLSVVLILALGIGATTAIFSLVEGILLKPLPFSDPDQLVLIGDRLGANSGTSVTAREIGTYSSATPEQVNAARLTASVFPTLGVQPVLGRVFTRQEEDAHQPLAVLSYALWL